MSVRAKFTVQSKTDTNCGYKKADGSPGIMTAVKLSPVMSGSDENKAFFDASPSGSIELGVLNPAAADQFVVGAEYYIDFTKA